MNWFDLIKEWLRPVSRLLVEIHQAQMLVNLSPGWNSFSLTEQQYSVVQVHQALLLVKLGSDGISISKSLYNTILHLELNQDKQSLDVAWRRDWRAYNKDMLCLRLSSLNWNFTSDSVQAYWNELENKLVAIVDELAPMVKHNNFAKKY